MTDEEREELKHRQRLLNASSSEERDRIQRERDDARREQRRDFKPDPAKQAEIEARIENHANKTRAAAAAMRTPAAEQDHAATDRRGRRPPPTGKRASASQRKRRPRRRARNSERKADAAAPRTVNSTELPPQLIGPPIPVMNRDRLIMPRSIAQVDQAADPCYLARFGRAVHRDSSGQLLMGFATEGERGPTLPANVWTMGLESAEKRGAPVPLALRIWMACILHTPLRARGSDLAFPLGDLTLHEFLLWLYAGLPKPRDYWGPLTAAAEVINAHRIPYERDGLLWTRQVVNLDMPESYHRGLLKQTWPVLVWFPPGDGTGPLIDYSRLQRWHRQQGGNGACWRALINLSYRWHVEGLRLLPVRGGEHWVQRRNPKLYDKLTDADKDAICFPTGTGKKRRDHRLADANEALELLVREGDTIAVDGRLLPPIRKAENGRGYG